MNVGYSHGECYVSASNLIIGENTQFRFIYTSLAYWQCMALALNQYSKGDGMPHAADIRGVL